MLIINLGIYVTYMVIHTYILSIIKTSLQTGSHSLCE